jgi:hypothetical protein
MASSASAFAIARPTAPSGSDSAGTSTSGGLVGASPFKQKHAVLRMEGSIPEIRDDRAFAGGYRMNSWIKFFHAT